MAEQNVPRRSIAVGVDASAEAEEALSWAAAEARRRNLPLTLVHGVGPSVTAWMEVGSPNLREVLDTMIAAGRDLLDRAEARVLELAPGVDTYRILRLAGPHEALMALAPEAEMIVVGTRSAGSRGVPLPDVAERLVAEHPPCPVIVPRAGGADPKRGMVVLCDGSPESRVTLVRAWRRARENHQPLTVLLCLPDPPEDGPATDIGLMDAMARIEAELGPSLLGFERALVADMVAEMRSALPGVDAQLFVDDDAVDECLKRVPVDADMLVAGAPHARRVAEVVGASASDEGCVTAILPALLPEEREVVGQGAGPSAAGTSEAGDVPPDEPAPVRVVRPRRRLRSGSRRHS